MLFGDKELNFDTPKIMGIINITPDSFSDGGKFFSKKSSQIKLSKDLKEIDLMEKNGAAFIDIGAESTRPGYTPISDQEEMDRILPILEKIKEINAIISVDSSKAKVIKEAIKNGVGLINDVNSLSDMESKKELKKSNLPICIMHKKEKLSPMSICEEVSNFFENKISDLTSFGIDANRIIIDPGFGYGKTPKENINLLANFDYSSFSNKSLVGLSRKGFLKKISIKDDLDDVSISAAIISSLRGASIIRVHNVADTMKKMGEIFG